MDISFASKKEDEDLEEKKIEFGKKFDPAMGQEKKKGPTLSDIAKGVSAEVDEASKEQDSVDDDGGKKDVSSFFAGILSKIKSLTKKNDFVGSGSSVLEVNLVREEIVKYFDWQKGVLLCFLVIFASLSIISLADWGISWWGATKQRSKDSEYEKSFDKMVKEIKDSEAKIDEVLAFKKQVDLANFLLQNHIYWSNFFDFLEENTLSNVYFSSFSGSVSGNYLLSATSNNFDAINAQTKKFLNNPYVRSAKVDAGQITGSEGSASVYFSFVFELDPEVFLKKK